MHRQGRQWEKRSVKCLYSTTREKKVPVAKQHMKHENVLITISHRQDAN